MDQQVQINRPVCPTLDMFGGDYAEYAKQYRVYLDIVTEYEHSLIDIRNHAQSGERRGRREAQGDNIQMPLVAFASQVQTFERPPSYERTGEQRSVRRSSPSSFLSVPATQVVQRLEYLDQHFPRGSKQPPKKEIRAGLKGVVTSEALEAIIDRRKPKSYRSLINLREMCQRIADQRGTGLFCLEQLASV